MMERKMDLPDISALSVNDISLGLIPESDKFYDPEGNTYLNGFPTHLRNITDFNVWSRSLKENEMRNWTLCEETFYGDIIDWNEIAWIPFGMNVDKINYDRICQKIDSTLVLKKDISFPDSKIQSKAFRGNTMVIMDNTTQNQVLNLNSKMNLHCKNGK